MSICLKKPVIEKLKSSKWDWWNLDNCVVCFDPLFSFVEITLRANPFFVHF